MPTKKADEQSVEQPAVEEAQGEQESVDRESGIVKTNSEGYGYKYTDLAGIHQYLEKTKQAYYQFIEVIDGVDYIMTQKQTVDDKGNLHNNGEPLRGSRVVLGALGGGKNNAAQDLGAALTYARRYSVQLAFGLATEDDDGESLTRSNDHKDSPNKIDFDAVRKSIKEATNRDEVEHIYSTVPDKLRQYFIKDCERRVKELEGE